jgi:hypothetical protein
MMMSEFIELTGFEPTAAEYEEIEAEYMGCDIDKTRFCKDWKRNGGIQRLSRMRVRRIEELEQQLATMKANYEKRLEWYENRETELCGEVSQARKERDEIKITLDAIKNLV